MQLCFKRSSFLFCFVLLRVVLEHFLKIYYDRNFNREPVHSLDRYINYISQNSPRFDLGKEVDKIET